MRALLGAFGTRLRLRPGWLRLQPEGQRGFDAFVAMADRKMSFPLGWSDELDGPATRRVTLFERSRRAGPTVI
jgi:hypothetical protein